MAAKRKSKLRDPQVDADSSDLDRNVREWLSDEQTWPTSPRVLERMAGLAAAIGYSAHGDLKGETSNLVATIMFAVASCLIGGKDGAGDVTRLRTIASIARRMLDERTALSCTAEDPEASFEGFLPLPVVEIKTKADFGRRLRERCAFAIMFMRQGLWHDDQVAAFVTDGLAQTSRHVRGLSLKDETHLRNDLTLELKLRPAERDEEELAKRVLRRGGLSARQAANLLKAADNMKKLRAARRDSPRSV